MDAASLLKRFFFCEQALVVAQGGWLGHIAPLEVKTTLPRYLWEDAMTADALRNRVFELHYPSRLVEVGDDAPVVSVFSEAIHAPGPEAFILSLARVFKPALWQAYQAYLAQADDIADGPTLRFLNLAVTEKVRQIEALAGFAEQMLASRPERKAEAEAWCATAARHLDAIGGVSLRPYPHTASPRHAILSGRREFALAQIPARDPRFHLCRFYWPDILDPNFPYGDGIRLQLRSAISHLNEVWAVETGGAILYAFAEALGWEFIFDAARWTYDESRHTRMGYERLRGWGFEPQEIPLGTYIYDSAFGQDPIYRLGMLFFFETKNIGKKTDRIKAFNEYHDSVSQHDMDYDWADETLHTHYGQRWLKALLVRKPPADSEPTGGWAALSAEAVQARCGELVAAVVESASAEERAEVHSLAEALIHKAERLARAPA